MKKDYEMDDYGVNNKMRLKIKLESKKHLHIPFNYNHILSSVIYNKIADLNLANELHSSTSFKFFTFSQINIQERKMVKSGFISKNGVISFQIASPNEYLIKSLVEGYLEDLQVNFKGQNLFVEKIELLPIPKFENEMKFKTISPIIIRTKKEIDGDLKTWDLNPSDPSFYINLEKNLVKKYNKLYDKEIATDNIKITSEMKFVKGKRIAIKKGNIKTYNKAFMMDIAIKGDKNLIKFGYDCGLGEKNSLGFGMIDLDD
ncbi:MAG: CRISPR-associated endoribonuclease Cas6 [Methanobacteriaceae archaeon]|jgi:CRISPR-associated endoribonuclease Cas6|nr:CRISPR-associated endoribonuclease Cas6 [Candidatus Methanorudis spinitermitis]